MSTVLTLTEASTQSIESKGLSRAVVEELTAHYTKYLKIRKIGASDTWEVETKNWIGVLPIRNGDQVIIEPKLGVYSVLAMLNVAFDLGAFSWFEGLYQADAIELLIERIVSQFAARTLERLRIGLYRSYDEREERLFTPKGKILVEQVSRYPVSINVPCRYSESTLVNVHNLLLAAAAEAASKLGNLREDTELQVRKVHKTLLGALEMPAYLNWKNFPEPIYDRLNGDYQELHALARLVLLNTAPEIRSGQFSAIPFALDMAKLYERYVAKLIERALPAGYRLRCQETVEVFGPLTGFADMVIYDASGRPACVLDTKYKDKLLSADFYQVSFYAHQLDCSEAILVFPVKHKEERSPLPTINLRVVCIPIDRPCEESVEGFMNLLNRLAG